MTTTREKFRARRAARIFQGRHWKPAQIRRMAALEPRPPFIINMVRPLDQNKRGLFRECTDMPGTYIGVFL